LAAIGLAADRGDELDTDGTEGVDDDATDFDFGDSDTCDGVVVVHEASGTAEVPGGETRVESTASVECIMSEGSDDEDAVRALQDALVRCNGQDIAVDGDYGQQTRQAVARVEEENGLSVDGTFGPETRDAMRWPATSASGTTTCVSVVSSSTASADSP
jgi:hypothetical protein